MNCREALSLLYDIIDSEASEIDINQVEEHLEQCHDCSGIYEIEHSVNKLIQEKITNQEPTPNFAKLKANILQQLNKIDTEDC